jgi:predicted DNA-binding transcriptional regulator AlpA
MGEFRNLLTSKQVAEHFKISESTVREWRVLGEGPPFVKISRSVRYRPEDIERWAKAREFTKTGDMPTAGGRAHQALESDPMERPRGRR